MTHQRTIEAGARAAYHATPRNRPYDKLTLFKKEKYRAEAAAVLASLSTEGFVVVPREATGGVKSAIRKFVQERAIPSPSDNDPDGVYFDCGHARELYTAIVTAAQQEQNDAGE